MRIHLQTVILSFIALTIFLSLTNFVETVPYTIVLILTSITIVYKEGFKIFYKQSFILILLFYWIFLIYGLLDHGVLSFHYNYIEPIYTFISIFSFYIISTYLVRLNSIQVRFLLIASLFALFVSLLIGTYVATINPMAIRSSDDLTINFIGLLTYSQAHSLSVISVGLCTLFCFTKKRMIRTMSFILWLFSIKLQFDMTITTALLLSVLCSVIVIVNRIYRKSKVIILVMFISLILLLMSSTFIIDMISRTESENIYLFQKINDLYISLSTGSTVGQVDYRNELYITSLNTFLSNPLFGWAKDNGSRTVIGEHSFFIDYLAYYGIFALLYFISWYKHYKLVVINRFPSYRSVCLYSFIPVIMLWILKASSVASALPFSSLIFINVIFSYLQNESSGE